MNRLFLDANVLFTAAHNPHGKAALIIELGAEGHWRLITSVFAAEEARRNVQIKFPAALPALNQLLTLVNFTGPGPGTSFPDGLPEKDQPIFQAALSAKATHLLTGDVKHFGRFMNRPAATYGVVIQTVAEFLDSL